MVNSHQIHTTDKWVPFSSERSRCLRRCGAHQHRFIWLAFVFLSTNWEKKTRHLSLKTGPPTVQRLFRQEKKPTGHYQKTTFCLKTIIYTVPYWRRHIYFGEKKSSSFILTSAEHLANQSSVELLVIQLCRRLVGPLEGPCWECSPFQIKLNPVKEMLFFLVKMKLASLHINTKEMDGCWMNGCRSLCSKEKHFQLLFEEIFIVVFLYCGDTIIDKLWTGDVNVIFPNIWPTFITLGLTKVVFFLPYSCLSSLLFSTIIMIQLFLNDWGFCCYYEVSLETWPKQTGGCHFSEWKMGLYF